MADDIQKAAEVAATAAQAAAKVASTAAETAARLAIDNATLVTDIKYIQRDIGEIKVSLNSLSGKYVTQDQFDPVKRIVYGLVTVLGLATMAAIFRLIFVQ